MSPKELISYDLERISETCFIVNKNGIRTYRIDFKSKRWVCSCPARKECKHLKLLPAEVLVTRHTRERITQIIEAIRPAFGQLTHEVCGSYRRLSPASKDVDIIVLCTQEEYTQLLKRIEALPFYTPNMSGQTIIRGKLWDVPFDIDRVDCEEDWAPSLLFRTGPKDFNIKMRTLAKGMGLRLNEHGIEAGGEILNLPSEESIFAYLGVPYLNPEERK